MKRTHRSRRARSTSTADPSQGLRLRFGIGHALGIVNRLSWVVNSPNRRRNGRPRGRLPFCLALHFLSFVSAGFSR